ncbi:MAG: hypothetical protein ACOYYS_00210 [Chloroflexota bacterium]
MESRRKVQFLVAHYSTLQGLKLVPIGLLCVYLPIWGNFSGELLSRLLAACVYIGVMAGLTYLVEWWYKRTFGVVRPTVHEQWVNGLAMAFAGAFSLVVFWLDYYLLHLSGFLFGLWFAAALVWDYVRALIAVGEHNIWFFPAPPIVAIVMILSSLLPLVGVPWWQLLGLRSAWSGVFLMMGLLMIVLGVSNHVYLVRSLPRLPEVKNEHAV